MVGKQGCECAINMSQCWDSKCKIVIMDQDSTKLFTREEVSHHDREDDIWLIKDGKVYDLTAYYKFHPGGSAMLKHAGKDVTFVLPDVMAHGFSRDFIESKLDEVCIGRLK